LALIIFLTSIAAATFIESIYGIQTAKLIVYNATWFELLLIYLCFNLISNIFKHRMFQREKIALLTFHLSFIIIIIGAGITRFYSFDGLMLIREGKTSDFIFTSDPYLLVSVQNLETGEKKTLKEQKIYMSEIYKDFYNKFEYNYDFSGKDIAISYLNFQSKMIDSFVINSQFKEEALELVTDGMKSNFLCENDIFMLGEIPLSFEKELATPGIETRKFGDSIQVKTLLPLRYLAMSEMQKARQSGQSPSDSMFTEIPLNKWVNFKTTTLYQVGDKQFVFKRKIKHAKKMLVSSGKKNVGSDYLTVLVKSGKQSIEKRLEGGMGAIPTPTRFELNGLSIQLEYGSIHRKLPFAILCRDFILDKYPGSESPSSFASELTILDKAKKYERNQRVFMNNIMDYEGYRFFQSSYDLDDPSTPENEEGTRLSVNHDAIGTNVTYFGYLLMTIGMVLSLFAPKGRFRDLNEKLRKLKIRREKSSVGIIIVLLSLNSFISKAQESHDHTHDHKNEHFDHKNEKPIFRIVSEEHSEKLAKLLVQDFDGRIVPFHTLSDQLLRKIYRGNKFRDLNASQVIISMHMYPKYWMDQKIVQVPSNLREILNLKEYASSIDLMAEDGNFKWLDEYKISHQKLESKRDEFDKKLIKLNEKFEVLQGIFTWQYMRIIPKMNDKNNTWFIPMDMELLKIDTLSSITSLKYLSAIDKGAKNNDFSEAESLLAEICAFQRKIGKNVVPSENQVNIEISYNKMEIFKNTYRSYGLIGFLMLILFFVQLFIDPKSKILKLFKILRIIFFFLLTVFFVYHGIGLGFRWFISGHAPWSNGYEAIIFIAWVTMIFGFIFSRKNAVIIAGTAILASLMIFVTEMNLLDPEITPLVPVLKSYWLMIHVAIITGSYGPLGLAAILGLINLLLYIFRTQKNGKMISIHISELTYVSEMAMTIGVFMLTIGTFLGGVWANESWGRYWAWDPKETWALVSVLVYAVILHFRFIPKLNSKFVFNAVALWGYSAILFTFFGVNFMLVGLHSYAQGEGLGEFPNWLIVLIISFLIFTIFSGIRYKAYKKLNKEKIVE
jgi:cytochrome c-type biogenesis protein CcsB